MIRKIYQTGGKITVLPYLTEEYTMFQADKFDINTRHVILHCLVFQVGNLAHGLSFYLFMELLNFDQLNINVNINYGLHDFCHRHTTSCP